MTERLRVAAISAGRNDPAARFRIGQYQLPLKVHGIDLAWHPAPVSKYPPRALALRPFWLPAAVAGRLPATMASWRADITLLGREMVSTLTTFERWTRRPRVLDVDDAIWLHRGGKFARRLAGMADLVVAGNTTIGNWFGAHCTRVEILPTAVDTARFTPAPSTSDSAPGLSATIGWCGTSSNLATLLAIEPALAEVMHARPHVRMKVCSDRAPRFCLLPADRCDFEVWSAASEASFFRRLDIGLMPLQDNAWSRGKCAYKMLLYLASGTPAVVSPVGMNAEVLAQSDVGFGPNSQKEWVDALIALVDDPATRTIMGMKARKLVVDWYSVDVLAPRFAGLLRQVVD